MYCGLAARANDGTKSHEGGLTDPKFPSNEWDWWHWQNKLNGIRPPGNPAAGFRNMPVQARGPEFANENEIVHTY